MPYKSRKRKSRARVRRSRSRPRKSRSTKGKIIPLSRYASKSPKNYIGQVKFVKLPNNKWPRPRWLVRINSNGNVVARAPKIGASYNDIYNKKESVFNKETVLPKGTIVRV